MAGHFGRILTAGSGLALLACSMAALAGQADVVEVKARKSGEGWHFDVTVAHQDTGWEHYADAWEVVGPDGTVYGTRELLHPHVDEQPFTRSLSNVEIPDSVGEVIIRARDSVHGFGGKTFRLELPR